MWAYISVTNDEYWWGQEPWTGYNSTDSSVKAWWWKEWLLWTENYCILVMLWFLCNRSSWVHIHCTSEWMSIKTCMVHFVLQKSFSLDLPLNYEMCKGPADFDELHLFHTLCVVGGWVVLHFLFLIINVESKLNPEQSPLCNQQLMCVTVLPSSVSAAFWFFLDFR